MALPAPCRVPVMLQPPELPVLAPVLLVSDVPPVELTGVGVLLPPAPEELLLLDVWVPPAALPPWLPLDVPPALGEPAAPAEAVMPPAPTAPATAVPPEPEEEAPPEALAPPEPVAPPPLAPPEPLPLVPPEEGLPPEPDVPPDALSAGGVPGFPVALSFVNDITAMPFTQLTFWGLCVDRLKGDDQLPTDHPAGMFEPSNSWSDGAPKVPLSYEEYCTQLMYSWTGSVVLLMSPPKLAFPGHRLK